MNKSIVFTLVIAFIGGIGAALSLFAMCRHQNSYGRFQVKEQTDSAGIRRYYPVDAEEDGDNGEE